MAAPQLMGITGDDDDFHCRNCLTKTFHVANDDVVRCPHPSCGRPVGFLPLTSLAQEQIVATVSVFGTPQGLRPDNDFFNRECIDKIREQPEVMNNLIAFTSEEAKMILYHICVLEDQVMDPVALGGVPGYMTAEAHNSLQAGFSLNDFVCGLLTEMQTPKLITTPLELEEDLGTLFSKLLHRYTLAYHQDKLARWGIDLSDEDAVLSAALENYKPISELKEN
ncbi:hypothetical protein BDW02DRAFT_598692 [Decorospora gaudefroyi]|uniref:Uncharacterized protein n=1 Tax=Decorospora gaudefroyi TaxID=184978 RepID=A0A6A5KHA2_9PLEO|nr:hypothetical protein BDW02DRAFT_598692 [Decorospora gaudefroyi]